MRRQYGTSSLGGALTNGEFFIIVCNWHETHVNSPLQGALNETVEKPILGRAFPIQGLAKRPNSCVAGGVTGGLLRQGSVDRPKSLDLADDSIHAPNEGSDVANYQAWRNLTGCSPRPQRRATSVPAPYTVVFGFAPI